MRIVPNLPAHQPPTTLAGYAKVIPAHDEKFCRYKIQLNINNLKEAQMTTFMSRTPDHFGRICESNFCPRQINLSL